MMRRHRMLIDPCYPWRREKRLARRFYGDGEAAARDAWHAGCHAAMFQPNRRNPYPPGRRHDEFERGRLAGGDHSAR
jgi:hypothetical protein